jgi:hypothetical protein
MEESSLGHYKLTPGASTDIALEIQEMKSHEERYEILFADFGFSWIRTASRLPLNWLKGGPAPAPEAAKPGPENPHKAKPSKPPFWQFWKRGE